jgi:DNA-directed RNA polymerase subunit beta
MPFLEDGTPVDIVLNHLGYLHVWTLVYETVLGWAGQNLGRKFATLFWRCFSRSNQWVNGWSWNTSFWTYLPMMSGTGGVFASSNCRCIIYVKLGHMVDDKMHTRSIGPYS